MRAGLLDRRITLQQFSGGSWSTTRSDWAEIRDHGADINVILARSTEGERRVTGAHEAPSDLQIFAIRYDGTITDSWRILDESGEAWNILGVAEGDGRKEETLLACVPFVDYDDEHDSLVADASGGAAVTFTKVRTVLDPATNTHTASASSVSGTAERIPGDPDEYERLGLKESEAPTLLFTPTTRGQKPDPGSTVTWGGIVYQVKEVFPVDPDGTGVIRARVVIVR